jgi:collagenase-like PrtC family protease
MSDHAAALTLGPVLFNWKPDSWRDFYLRIADEAPVDTVYLGEVVCGKRAPLFEPVFDEVAERLQAAGKTVVLSTLAEVALKHDRQLVDRICSADGILVEANDGSALLHLRGRPHHIGPFVNVYNERTAEFLARGGACNFCLPHEMPAATIRALCDATRDIDATFEVQVFGRVPLALSARCYHARAHSRTKDSCQFVCDEDPDGLDLDTIEGRPFLSVNGIQTLSYDYLNMIHELAELRAMGVSRFRLSPHSCDMAKVASIFRAVLDGRMAASEAAAQLNALQIGAPFSNGFYYGKPGHRWIAPAAAASGAG